MQIKQNTVTAINNSKIVTWDPKYSVGIKIIDEQHRELVSLTNQLHKACTSGETSIADEFKDIMQQMVEYVRMHFSTENVLLESVGFPDYPEHKKLHETLVKDILTAVKEFEGGNRLAPNHFVRTLKEWIFGHIAFFDQAYAHYIHEQVRRGLIKKEQLE